MEPMLTTSFGGWGASSTCVSSIIHKYNYHKQSRLSLHPPFIKSHLVDWHLGIFLPFFLYRQCMHVLMFVCVVCYHSRRTFVFILFSLGLIAYICSFLCAILWIKQSANMKWDTVISGSLTSKHCFMIIYAFHILTINIMIYRWEEIILSWVLEDLEVNVKSKLMLLSDITFFFSTLCHSFIGFII